MACNVPSMAVLILSLFSIIGRVSISKISRPSFKAVSDTIMPISAKIPIRFAVICCAVSLPNAENISANAAAKFPTISAMSELILNILIIYCFIRSTFWLKYFSMPPMIFLAIVMPTLTRDPVICPREYASLFAKLSAAAITSGSVNISFSDWPMDCISPMISSIAGL